MMAVRSATMGSSTFDPSIVLAETPPVTIVACMIQRNIAGRYINLDRSEERRRQVESELAKLQSLGTYERFAAVDGAQSSIRPDVRHRAMVGCYLSHLEVIRRHIGADAWLHVVEDDVLVSRHAQAAIRAICAHAQFAKYDIIFTNVRLCDNAEVIAGCRKLFDRSVSTTPEGQVLSIDLLTAVPLDLIDFLQATSYLVNPRSAGRVADLLVKHLSDEPLLAIDSLYSRLSRDGDLAVACTIPFFTMPRIDIESTINDRAPWAIGHRIKGAALYADRDVGELRARLKSLSESGSVSVTDELIADAYRYLIRIAPT